MPYTETEAVQTQLKQFRATIIDCSSMPQHIVIQHPYSGHKSVWTFWTALQCYGHKRSPVICVISTVYQQSAAKDTLQTIHHDVISPLVGLDMPGNFQYLVSIIICDK